MSARADRGQAPGRRRDRRLALALVGVYLAAGGSSYAPEKTQDPCKHRPWRNPEGLQRDRRAVLALGPRRRCLPARGHRARRWPGRWRRRRRANASPSATGSTTRSWRRRSGPGCCGRSTTPKKPARSAPSSPARCGARSRNIPLDRAIELVNNARSLLDNAAGFLGPAGNLLEELPALETAAVVAPVSRASRARPRASPAAAAAAAPRAPSAGPCPGPAP